MYAAHWKPGILMPLIILVASALPARAQSPTPAAQSQASAILALIDKLQEISEEDTGYSQVMFGAGSFPPLETFEPGPVRIYEKPATRSGTIRELVKRGAAAVPHLIAHLDDRRPTKITIGHVGIDAQIAIIGGMFYADEYDYNSRTAKEAPKGVNPQIETHGDSHTVTVGDLCFTVLGEIVNRSFPAVRPQPTACRMINSPTHSEALRKAIEREWNGLTPERHKESLVRDFVEPDGEGRRYGACVRLGYYYPDTLEPLALRQLAEPRYNVFDVQTLIRTKLYRAKDAAERRRLFDDFVAKRGEVARLGILVYLFEDLDRQESVEQGRFLKDDARVCLMELFQYSKDVKSKDRPQALPLENCEQARFIHALAYFPTAKIDQAVLQIMRSTDENNLAVSCAWYLVGRGADMAIRKSVEQRLRNLAIKRDKHAAEWLQSQLQGVLEAQGWTPLHVAVQNGDPDRIVGLLRTGADRDARAVSGQTPLHVAADAGNDEAIHVLLERRADPNLKDAHGLTPVQLAMHNDYDSTVELLLHGGATAPDILVASFAGRADLVRTFLQKDKSLIGRKTDDGNTPLHVAARRGHANVAEVLLACGADVNARSDSDLTALHWAAARGSAQVVRVLLSHKADPATKGGDDRTPLDIARQHGNKEIIQLLERGR